MSFPPSVDKLARSIEHHDLPWPILVEVAQEAIATDQVDDIEVLATKRYRQLLNPVLNGTGVLLHTNMGRAPLALNQTASFSNLEIDVETGQRGSRQKTIGNLLATACGAEAAMAVNNCASALMLALGALANGQKVAVSRGELVEIGGGFRVPDVMRQSGAELVEVGTTNRTRLRDYQKAVDGDAAALALKVHQSNYSIVGFTEEVSIRELSSLDIPVIADIGSGLLDSTCPWLPNIKPPAWLENEPAARQTLEAGADLVLFSGDKLFGGPQAGILAGSAELIAACAAHPLARATRPGSLVLHALQTTTLSYLNRDGQAIEFWRMATIDPQTIQQRATAVVESLRAENPDSQIEVISTESVPGGGTLPTVTIPSVGVEISGDLSRELRAQPTPLIARVVDNATIVDLRTIHPDADQQLIASLSAALSQSVS